MYIEVVLRIERDNNSPIVINTTAQGVFCLLGSNNMTELDENLTVGITYYYGTRKNITLNFNCFVSIRSWYFYADNISKSFTFRYYVLLYSFNFLIIKKIFYREHIQKLNYSTCCCAVLSYRKLFIIGNCFMHLDVYILLKTFASSLNFKPFVFYLQLVERFNSFIRCSLIIIFKKSVAFVHTIGCSVFD